ncbi:MAG: hypothetical protein ABI634_13915 [Acidobacteriota bacterium]
MGRTRLGILLGVAAITAASVWTVTPSAATSRLPARLSDQEFWRLSSTFSEPGGTFHSDNFVSNEGQFQTVIPDLIRRVPRDGFYVGVGPEQNFTYMAAIRPRMAFIVDIRRGNLQEHLLYKALIEMSADRAEFVARLFSRPRPATLNATSTVAELFDAVAASTPTEALYRQNLLAVTRWLTTTHRLPLSAEDLMGIDYIYRTAFFTDGPGLNYQLTGAGRGAGRGVGTPSYAQLMAMDDGAGRQRSYLASEQNFAYLKTLESNNLVVPVVGDFGGPRALRAVGKYARDNDASIAAFYVSNVEQYLVADGKWNAFCANVASMPIDHASTFIRSVRGGGGGRQSGVFAMFRSSLAAVSDDTRACAAAGAR